MPELHGRVLIVGLGGLGTAAAVALAGAGVRELTLVDDDAVAPSNLHRQLLYSTPDVGMAKVKVAARRLAEAFPQTQSRAVMARLDPANVLQLMAGHDFVIDATDDTQSKFSLNDAAVRTAIPLSHAGVVGWLGQTFTILPRRSACLRCLFPEVPDEAELGTCQTQGVLGGVVGSIAAIQAAEAVKVLRHDVAGLLADRFVTYDARCGRWRTIPLKRNPDCPVCAFTPGAAAAV